MQLLNETIGKNYAMYNGDCCELIQALPDDSVGYSVFSPPFASLFVYSDSERDMGNCDSDEHFFQHFSFLVKELYRVLKP
ncbi:site-specific DNA-methyltransferase, partial [Escherichia coli]|nr:site-specific DNA-methyltransferase [Escherichia coli]